MSNYARADVRAQWFATAYPGARIDPRIGVIHTTEGTNWPSYSGGATAPTYTGLPDIDNQRILWRAHFPDEMSSRALRNLAGGVETNTLDSVQVELIGTCSPGIRDDWKRKGLTPGEDFLYWPDAPDWALREVAALVADMNRRHDIPITAPAATWLAYPASYGQDNGNRLTFEEWRGFRGWLGHQHVPENSHGDPGALRWAVIARYAREFLAPPPEPPTRGPLLNRLIVDYKANVEQLRDERRAAKKAGQPVRRRRLQGIIDATKAARKTALEVKPR